MRRPRARKLNTSDLRDGKSPAIPPYIGAAWEQSCSISFAHHNHPTPVDLLLEHKNSVEPKRRFVVEWPAVDLPAGRSISGLDSTEWAAYGIAALICRSERRPKYFLQNGYNVDQTTGFDWYLGSKRRRLDQFEIRLEVSGILSGGKARVNERVDAKLKQTRPSDHTGLPVWIIVVSFREPLAMMAKRDANTK